MAFLREIKTAAFTLSLLAATVVASAQSTSSTEKSGILDQFEREFDAQALPRVGLEIEYSGITLHQSAELLAAATEGSIEELQRTFEYVDPISKESQTLKMTSYKLRTKLAGKLRVKHEENGTSFAGMDNRYSNSGVIEIVSEPLSSIEKVEGLQNGLNQLKRVGAIGTRSDLAVSLQVNVEIGGGDRSRINVDEVLDILRNYLSDQNRRAIAGEMKVPKIREKYMGGLTKGFAQKVMDLNYRPSWKQFYEDAMYRQSLEAFGDPEAWKVPRSVAIERVQNRITQDGNIESVLPIMKWNYIRISSLMMYMMPNEWLTKTLQASGWIKPNPLLEFREMNNDFNLVRAVRRIVGFIQATQRRGSFIYDPIRRELVTRSNSRACRSIFLGVGGGF